jgi:class 3 adenylate cyclase
MGGVSRKSRGAKTAPPPSPRATRKTRAGARSRTPLPVAWQRTYYVAAEYIDSGDRLLVEDGDDISLYSVDLKLAQHWYAAAWRGKRFDLAPFVSQQLDSGMDPQRAERIKDSGLVLARCCRHGAGMPMVEKYKGNPVYGSAVEILIGEVFEGSLSYLIERATGVAGLTISPMHTGYAIHDGRPIGNASIETVAESVRHERPYLGSVAAPDGTVTILFSDIEDSTVLNDRMGDARWMELLREHNEIVRREVGLHRGFEVKTIGDAFMIAFQSAKDAVRCGIAVQRAFSKRNNAAADPIRVRVGLHVGEVVRDGDDFYGRHVNFAARVAAQAEAAEVLVSSLVREVVAPSGEFDFAARPKRALKGFLGKHVLYAVRIAGGKA